MKSTKYCKVENQKYLLCYLEPVNEMMNPYKLAF